MESKILVKNQFSHLFLEMINLKYSNLLAMIEEINSIANYFIDEDGSTLFFHICKGTDQTFLWKLTVRIECVKVNKILFIFIVEVTNFKLIVKR